MFALVKKILWVVANYPNVFVPKNKKLKIIPHPINP